MNRHCIYFADPNAFYIRFRRIHLPQRSSNISPVVSIAFWGFRLYECGRMLVASIILAVLEIDELMRSHVDLRSVFKLCDFKLGVV